MRGTIYILCWLALAAKPSYSDPTGVSAENFISVPPFAAGPAQGLYGCDDSGVSNRFQARPSLTLHLRPILNAHWKARQYVVLNQPLYLTLQFGREDNQYPYIGLWDMSGQSEPAFYKLGLGSLGEWTHNGLPVQLVVQWRWPLENSEIKFVALNGLNQDQAIGTIGELVLNAYDMGQPVRIGPNTYQLFFYNEIDLSGKAPHRVLYQQYGMSFVYRDKGKPMQFHVPLESIENSCPVAWHLFGGQTVGLRHPGNSDVLEVYGLN